MDEIDTSNNNIIDENNDISATGTCRVGEASVDHNQDTSNNSHSNTSTNIYYF